MVYLGGCTRWFTLGGAISNRRFLETLLNQLRGKANQFSLYNCTVSSVIPESVESSSDDIIIFKPVFLNAKLAVQYKTCIHCMYCDLLNT